VKEDHSNRTAGYGGGGGGYNGGGGGGGASLLLSGSLSGTFNEVLTGILILMEVFLNQIF
jgi:hypothetical protein